MRLGYLGRRSIFEEVRRIVFDVAFFERGDITLVDAGIRESGDIVLPCGDYRCLALRLFTTLPKLLGGGKLGVDLGTSKNGVAYVWSGRPFLHAVLDWAAVEEILKNSSSLEVYIGSSPYVDVKRAASLLCREVHLVDEVTASWSRPWLKRVYPQLEEDEIDALSFTLYHGVVANMC
ncbi:MAG: hypothetical protein ACK4M3_03620 [Pyrobaculum sp.]